MDGTVVTSTEQDEVVEGRLAAMCPMLDVVGIDEASVVAAGEPAALVA